jgi:hypothetical protein
MDYSRKTCLKKISLSAAIIAIAALGSSMPVSAQTITAGGTDAPTQYPFGTSGSYIGEYQELYSPTLFTSAYSIDSISFASALLPGLNNYPEDATYSLSVLFGYTPASNITATQSSFLTPTTGYTSFYGTANTPETLTATLTGTGVYDLNIVGNSPFVYNPSLVLQPHLAIRHHFSTLALSYCLLRKTSRPLVRYAIMNALAITAAVILGALLMDVTIDSASATEVPSGPGEGEFFVAGDSSNASEIYYNAGSNDPSLGTNNIGSDTLAPQTQFSGSYAAVPESSPIALVVAGGALLMLTAGLKARRRALAAN